MKYQHRLLDPQTPNDPTHDIQHHISKQQNRTNIINPQYLINPSEVNMNQGHSGQTFLHTDHTNSIPGQTTPPQIYHIHKITLKSELHQHKIPKYNTTKVQQYPTILPHTTPTSEIPT